MPAAWQAAFTLNRNGGGAVAFTATASVVNGVTTVTLSAFSGAKQSSDRSSTADTRSALASQISVGGVALDGDGDNNAGGNYTFSDAQGLFRLYGDVNGDAIVNGLDFGFFKNAFGTAPAIRTI